MVFSIRVNAYERAFCVLMHRTFGLRVCMSRWLIKRAEKLFEKGRYDIERIHCATCCLECAFEIDAKPAALRNAERVAEMVICMRQKENTSRSL